MVLGPAPVPAARPSLRERRRAETADLIAEAVGEVMARDGVEGFSVEGVVEGVGVSVRTVYRYFPDRAAMLEAALNRDDAATPYRPPTTPDEIASRYEELFPIFDERAALNRAVLAARVAGTLTWKGRTRRVHEISAALESVIDQLPDGEARAARAVIVYLANSLAWLAMRDESGLDGPEAAAAMGWAVRTLIADLAGRNQAARSESDEP